MNDRVGQPCVRVDSLAKVTGQASYIDDVTMPGMLYGKTLGSSVPHARIRSIDYSKALSLSGVRTVITGKDFPHLHGECIINIPFLAIDKVRYIGEPVAAVAADDPETAEEAVRRVQVEYEQLPEVFDPEEAIKRDAPLIHEDLATYRTISAVNAVPGTNIGQHFVLTLGDAEKGFQECDHVFEDRFTSPQVQHAAIEPHGCIAQVDAAGRITVWGQNDSPHRARKEIAQALGIPQAKVRVITGYVGGNFGGKGGLKPEAVAIALAHKLRGRPVKVVFSREEVFNAVTRSACVIHVKTGVKQDGSLIARHIRLLWDMGAYAEKGPTISLHGAILAQGPYEIPNILIESYALFTNKPMAGAMRGYGLPQVSFACESQMDMIAERLGLNPVELRAKNALSEGSKVVTGQRTYSVGMKECIRRLDAALAPKQIDDGGPAPSHGRVLFGTGIACAHKFCKTPSVSGAYVKIDEDGSASVVTSTVEVGQGSHTILMQIVAEVLGLSRERVTVSFADTDVTPYDTSTTSSRSTFHMGNAVFLAAQDARQKLLKLAADIFGIASGGLDMEEGRVLAPDGRSLSISEVLRTTFGAGAGAAVLGQAVFAPKGILGLEDVESKKLEAFSQFTVFHTYAAQRAVVSVDPDTGVARVLNLVAAHDLGRAINPINCEQQVEGALEMGMGYGLMEECIWEKGQMVNPGFLGYPVPTAMEYPDSEIFLVEKAHPQGPFGAKGVGEMALGPTAAAIANAVYDACGVRIRDLPLSPARVLAAMHKQKDVAASHSHDIVGLSDAS